MTYGRNVLIPGRNVVTEPVAHIASSANKGAASNDHRALSGAPLEHAVAASLAHHGPVQVVGIVLSPASRVDQVGLCSLVADATSLILDLVLGKEKLTIREAFLVPDGLSGL